MSLISTNVPNFVNGISQQPYPLRLNTQGAFQENGYSTVYTGLRKRMPTEHIAKVGNGPVSDCFVHTINRDGIEQYQLIFTNGNIQIFDMAGNVRPIIFVNSDYLTTTGLASESFAVTTVADYTFISNKTKVTAMGTPISTVRPHEGMVSVKLGNYGKTYTVTLNNITRVSVATPDGSVAAAKMTMLIQNKTGGVDSSGNATWSTISTQTIDTNANAALGTDVIAGHLYDLLATAGFNTSPWNLKNFGSIVSLTNLTTDFTMVCDDGYGNNAMVAIKDNLQKFSDLPATCNINGFTVQIVGSDTSTFDNYWVSYVAATNDATGVWKETLAPGTVLGFNAQTMPHQLTRNADGSFNFSPINWTPRICGDITSNPNPSFVGRTVNDVFFFQNRLGFLSDENYVQTETGKFFNMFRTTVTALLDSDPVDVNAATDKVAILHHAVAFNKQLILFSAMQQFEVDSTVLMSPKKVPIRPTTNFTTNINAKPVTAGRNMYFTADKGSWSNVQEFYAETISTVNDASDITAHVPLYIPSNVIKIATSDTESSMVFLSGNDRTRLYVYKYYFSGTEKLQSSWSHFTFGPGATILGCEFITSILYLVVSRPSGVYLEKMDFSIGAANSGEPFHVLLDRKVRVAKANLTYSAGTNLTTIALASIGYTPDDGAVYNTVAIGSASVISGTVLTATWNGTSLTIPGDQTGSDIAVGQQYTLTYTLSPLVISMPSRAGAPKPSLDGRTQVRKITFNHGLTGFYNILVTPAYRKTYTYTFSGAYLGSATTVLGQEKLDDGRFGAAVMCRNTDVTIQIQNSTPMPSNFLSADWEAFYVDRSQNV